MTINGASYQLFFSSLYPRRILKLHVHFLPRCILPEKDVFAEQQHRTGFPFIEHLLAFPERQPPEENRNAIDGVSAFHAINGLGHFMLAAKALLQLLADRSGNTLISKVNINAALHFFNSCYGHAFFFDRSESELFYLGYNIPQLQNCLIVQRMLAFHGADHEERERKGLI